jgi:hypothetical protein
MSDNWEKDANGNFTVDPLVGISTLIFAESSIGLRLEHLSEGDSFDNPSGFVQLIMTPFQAQELAEVLLRAVDKILKIEPTSKPS